MHYISTRNPNEQTDMLTAVSRGLAPDGGLYLPASLPALPADILTAEPDFHTAALSVATAYCSEVPKAVLQDLIEKRLPFIPQLERLDEQTAILELFHGPTLAFKDYGACFMAGLLAYARRHADSPLTILAATSGDTGSAVGQGFHGVEGIRVVLLYPSGKVSPLQEQQLTTIGDNVQALEVSGTFDDCQRMVKEAFVDSALQQEVPLSSANSINIGRLIPQAFYYVYLHQLLETPEETLIAVPSGNFGNLTAGLFAHLMGARVSGFLAACNANDIVPAYLQGAAFSPRPSIATVSNAMDVGNPSNFERLSTLFTNDRDAMHALIRGARVSDEETCAMIRAQYEASGYILDPHAAVAAHAVKELQHTGDATQAVLLGTAHPAKFNDIVADCIGKEPEMPARLAAALQKEKQAIPCAATYAALKTYLLETAE